MFFIGLVEKLALSLQAFAFHYRKKRQVVPQSCKVCYKADGFDYAINNPTWKAVLPEEYHNSVVCLTCFDTFAAKKQIEYHPMVLYFAGKKQSFSFQTTTEADLKKAWMEGVGEVYDVEKEIIQYINSLNPHDRFFHYEGLARFIINRTGFPKARAVFEEFIAEKKRIGSKRIQQVFKQIEEEMTALQKERGEDIC